MDSILNFIKKDFFLLSILFLVFINPFFYGNVIAMLLFVFVFFKLNILYKLIDENALILFLFSFTYEVFLSMRYDYIGPYFVVTLAYVLVPSLLYMVGKYITLYYRNHKIWLFLLVLLTFSFSIIPLISILLQIQENGFIEGTRSMYLLWDETSEFSATGLGSYFVLSMSTIGLISVNKNNMFEVKLTWFIVILFILSLICVLRLGSRTQLVIAVVSLFGTYILNIKKQSRFKNIVFASLFMSAIYYFMNSLSAESELLTFYADRINDSESGFDTAGGRTERWIGSLESLLTDPFGWEFTRYGYAHNLWLDVARVSGVIPLMFLVLFTINAFLAWLKSLKLLKKDLYLKNYLFMFFVSIILLFIVEPVIEGMYLLFLLFCFFVGFLKGINNKKITN